MHRSPPQTQPSVPNNEMIKNGNELLSSESDVNDNLPEIIYPSAKLGAITRKRNQIKKVMESNDYENVEALQNLQREFRQKIDNFSAAVKVEMAKVGLPKEEIDEYRSWVDSHLVINVNFDKEFHQYLYNVESSKYDLFSSNPQDSVINVDKDLANLKIMSHVEKPISCRPKNNFNSNLNFINDWENESLVSQVQNENSNDNSTLIDIMKKQNEISLMIAKTQARSHLPITEPDTFDGTDYLEYRPFIFSIERTIDERTTNASDRYYCLLKYTKGDARKLVKSCNHGDAAVAYEEARNLLEKTYGNKYQIANTYLEKLEKWNNIRSEDGTALNELSLFLIECNTVMKTVRGLNQLNSLKEIRNICKKLPYDLRKRFRDLAGTKLEYGCEVDFELFVNFVKK